MKPTLIALTFVGIVVLMASQVNNLRPPTSIRLATGPEGEHEYQTAMRYQQYMHARGVEVAVVPTTGSLESLAMVQAGEVDAGFMLNAANLEIDASENMTFADVSGGLVSIAAVGHVPLWVFYRGELGTNGPLDEFADLRGLRVSLGEPQSGTRALSTLLLTASELELDEFEVTDASPQSSKAMLLDGEIDAMFLVSGLNSQTVRDLLEAPGIEVLDLRLAATYARMIPILHEVDLLEGSISVAKLRPPTDKHLLTIASVLVAKEDFHPDIQILLLRAAAATQQGAYDVFPTDEVFPSVENLTVTPSTVATQHIGEGPTLLQRYLPFWIASPLERFYLLALPILLLLFPLVRNTPTAYTYMIRRRVTVWYKRIRQIELRLEHYSIDELTNHIAKLERLEQQLTVTINIPDGHLQSFYNLRAHIRLVVDRLRQRRTLLETQALHDGATT